MSSQSCGICGGDGQIGNSFGSTTKCPVCHGTGRHPEGGGLRDVTKTKPSHHRPPEKSAVRNPLAPSTFEGVRLANEIQAHTGLSTEIKTKLTREIVEYEASHGNCTQTFIRKIRKHLRPAV